MSSLLAIVDGAIEAGTLLDALDRSVYQAAIKLAAIGDAIIKTYVPAYAIAAEQCGRLKECKSRLIEMRNRVAIDVFKVTGVWALLTKLRDALHAIPRALRDAVKFSAAAASKVVGTLKGAKDAIAGVLSLDPARAWAGFQKTGKLLYNLGADTLSFVWKKGVGKMTKALWNATIGRVIPWDKAAAAISAAGKAVLSVGKGAVRAVSSLVKPMNINKLRDRAIQQVKEKKRSQFMNAHFQVQQALAAMQSK